jgi:hypothetical protein
MLLPTPLDPSDPRCEERQKHSGIPTEHQERWFLRTQKTLEAFYSRTGNEGEAIQQDSNGDVYNYGRPVAPSSHMPCTPHERGGGNRTCDNRRTADGTPGLRTADRNPDEREPAVSHGNEHPAGPRSTLKRESISCSSTNVGYSIQGLGHRMGAGKGTPLAALIAEIKETNPTIAGIQEHKLGPHDFSHLPGLQADFKWDWIGFPGPKRGQQGLGFFVDKRATILFTKHDRDGDCEVATVVIEVHGLVIATINTYWSPTGASSLAGVGTCTELVWQHFLATVDFRAGITFLSGDLNVDMLADNPKVKYVSSFITERLQMTRTPTPSRDLGQAPILTVLPSSQYTHHLLRNIGTTYGRQTIIPP